MSRKNRPKVRESVRNRIWNRAMNRCEKCSEDIVRNPDGSHNGSLHHRLVWRLGGRNQISNLVLLCLDCHRAIHDDESEAARLGFIAWFEPDFTPLWTNQTWVLLVPDGTFEPLDPDEAFALMRHTNATEPREGIAEPSRGD